MKSFIEKIKKLFFRGNKHRQRIRLEEFHTIERMKFEALIREAQRKYKESTMRHENMVSSVMESYKNDVTNRFIRLYSCGIQYAECRI